MHQAHALQALRETLERHWHALTQHPTFVDTYHQDIEAYLNERDPLTSTDLEHVTYVLNALLKTHAPDAHHTLERTWAQARQPLILQRPTTTSADAPTRLDATIANELRNLPTTRRPT